MSYCNREKSAETFKINSAIKRKKKLDEKFAQLKPTCKYCKINIPYKDFCKGKKDFCGSSKCRSLANRRSHSVETKKKISDSIRQEPVELKCNFCNNLFRKNRTKQKFCCLKCSIGFRTKLKRNIRPAFANYRLDCSFKFNLADYPEEFDFKLVEQFGWYQAKNRGNNLNGISRDHIVSVKYGFDNKIDPNVISHPANCQLIRHNENVSKGIKCKISVPQLLEKIEEWNNKYF